MLSKILDISYDVFVSSFVILQGMPAVFGNLSDTGRKSLLEDVLNLGTIYNVAQNKKHLFC